MSLYEDFELASQELDALTLEGFFGDNVKQLRLARDDTDTYEHLYNCFEDWAANDNQFGKQNVAHLIIVFLELYVDAWKGTNQKAIDILTSVFKGTADYPHLECTSAYIEYLRFNVEFCNLSLEEWSNPTVEQRKKLASALTNAYSKGVEFINKLMARLVALLQVRNGEDYDLPELSEMTLHKKTEKFLALSQGKYDVLVTSLDRGVRNADAHNSIYYHSNENVYLLKSTSSKGKKGKTRKIKPDDMIKNIYPFIGWISQAFIYSCIILCLAYEEMDRFKTSMARVIEIRRSGEVTL